MHGFSNGKLYCVTLAIGEYVTLLDVDGEFHVELFDLHDPTLKQDKPKMKNSEYIGKKVLLRFISSYKEVKVLDVKDGGKAWQVEFIEHGKTTWLTVNNSERYDYHFVTVL